MDALAATRSKGVGEEVLPVTEGGRPQGAPCSSKKTRASSPTRPTASSPSEDGHCAWARSASVRLMYQSQNSGRGRSLTRHLLIARNSAGTKTGSCQGARLVRMAGRYPQRTMSSARSKAMKPSKPRHLADTRRRSSADRRLAVRGSQHRSVTTAVDRCRLVAQTPFTSVDRIGPSTLSGGGCVRNRSWSRRSQGGMMTRELQLVWELNGHGWATGHVCWRGVLTASR